MERLTKYNCGTAVIKDKSRLSEAMKKLALYEDLEENNSRVQDTLKELRAHRDVYMKNSTPWRVINRAVNLLLGLNAEVEALRQSEDHNGEVTVMVDHFREVKKKIETNADRIRNMSDEELNELLTKARYCPPAICRDSNYICNECRKKWLKEKVE